MEQNNNTIETIEQLAGILRTHIGQIHVEDDKLEGWSDVVYEYYISLAELDAKYGGEISEWLYSLEGDVDLMYALNPCLADINAFAFEQYAIYLRDLAENGWSVSDYTLFTWMIAGLRFDQDTKTLNLTIDGIEKDLFTKSEELVKILRAHIGQIQVEEDKLEYGYEADVTYDLSIPLAELDTKYGGKISEWLDDKDDDEDLIYDLTPCLADINAPYNEQYANFLRNLVKDGTASSEHTLYDWAIQNLWFYQETKMLRLIVVGNEKDMCAFK